MKILRICISIILTIIVFSSCDKSENAPTETVPSDQIASAYYPGGLNSTFTYRQDTIRTGQNTFDSVGVRNSVFSNYAVTGGSENISQDNIISINGININSKLNFRRTDAGIYFLIDTLDIISVLSMIPDSLKEQIEFNIDTEINVFSTPFYTGKNYSAFKATIGSSNLPINFTLVEVKVNFEGEEEIFVEALLKNVLSQKIKYEIGEMIKGLTDAQRYVLSLFYFEGLIETEISLKLKIPLPTVKSKLQVATDILLEKTRDLVQ